VKQTIPAAVTRAAQQFGDALAIAEPDGPRLSYVDLHRRVRVVARALIAEGLHPGDRVAIWAPNTHHWVLAALGASYAGTTVVPVNTRFTGPEALDVMHRAGVDYAFVAGPFLGVDRIAGLRAAAAAEGHPLPRVIVRIPVEPGPAGTPGSLDWADLDEHAAAVPRDRADDRAGAVEPDQISDILFTSGTTGRSKGAMSAHRQSLSVAAAWAEIGRLDTTDRYLVINPFFNSFGFKAGILACLGIGATVVPQPVFDIARTLEVIARERITVLPGPPTIYQAMLDHPDRSTWDTSTLRLAVTGATTVPTVLIERMTAELSFETVLTAYGLTEAVVATMCRPGDDPATVAQTSGRAAAGFEVRISQVGEILLRGPNVMRGYLDDPAATAEAVDADGWLHTGDIGRLDEHGYLSITDRLKDMYICGGFNVYPAEVEQVLARLDGVAESVVIGVPDERLGEVGKAYVVTRPGFRLDAAEVVAFCRGRLANFKVPRQVEFRSELPRNASGKALKHVLRGENAR
jgi:acyl-CoA synthetase (AMP-forming)/AMP-acid ligase II